MEATVELDPEVVASEAVYKLLIGCVVPRPIAWVSTVDAAGVRNVAPFSFFMAITADPPTIAFSSSARAVADGSRKKDTLRNVETTGSFVVNMVDDALAEQMNVTSGDYAPEVDEFELAGIEAAPSVKVPAPRVAQAPVAMECRLVQTIPIGRGPNHLVIGEIIYFHIRDDVYDPRTGNSTCTGSAPSGAWRGTSTATSTTSSR